MNLQRTMKLFVCAFAVITVFGIASPARVAAAVDPLCENGNNFLGLPSWYKYLDVEYETETDSCNVVGPSAVNPDSGNSSLDLVAAAPRVALAVVEILLRIAGIAAVIFIIYGGFMYITSQGEPDKAKNARQSIINALIGLVIALTAIAGVNFVGTQLISTSAVSNGLGLPETPLGNDTIATILQMVFGLAGGIALVVISLAGFKYTVSQGDPGETTKAKNTIMYALVGLLVSIAAFTIVTFTVANV